MFSSANTASIGGSNSYLVLVGAGTVKDGEDTVELSECDELLLPGQVM